MKPQTRMTHTSGYYVNVAGEYYWFRSQERAYSFYRLRERQLGYALVRLIDCASTEILAGSQS